MRCIQSTCFILSAILSSVYTERETHISEYDWGHWGHGKGHLGYGGPRCNDFDCQQVCCPVFGACDPEHYNLCWCDDDPRVNDLVAAECSNGVKCNDYECEESCCPQYGLCVTEYGPCECQQGLDYLAVNVCANKPRPCTDDEIRECSDQCKAEKIENYDVFFVGTCIEVVYNMPKCLCKPVRISSPFGK